MSVYRPSNAKKRSQALRQKSFRPRVSVTQKTKSGSAGSRRVPIPVPGRIIPEFLAQNRMLRGGLGFCLVLVILSSLPGAGGGDLAATSLSLPEVQKVLPALEKNALGKSDLVRPEEKKEGASSSLKISAQVKSRQPFPSVKKREIEPQPLEPKASLAKLKAERKTPLKADEKKKISPVEEILPDKGEKFSEILANLSRPGPFVDDNGHSHRLTIDGQMQAAAEGLLERYQVPLGAIVAVEPESGKILALASRGGNKDQLPVALRSGFPAASLFKIVTGAAAVEESGMTGDSQVNYRGGNYTLSRSNYLPDRGRDKRSMSLDDAMGKSVNPVFARVALGELNSGILQEYARRFGFFDSLSAEIPVEPSKFAPVEDDFQLARTAAGFGDVTISPLHAALLSASIGNKGMMMKPYLVEQVRDPDGKLVRQENPRPLGKVVLDSTAEELTKMMEKTLTTGTGRKQFRKWKGREFKIAGKTGTLSGQNPKGRYHWFVGNAPSEEPEISVAALVIDPGNARINGTGLARLFLEKYFTGKK